MFTTHVNWYVYSKQVSKQMPRQPISFRLSDHELELLEANQLVDESLSLTAARLLRERLGITNGSIQNLKVKTLDRLIEDKVNQLKDDVNSYVNNRVNSLIERIEALEIKPKTPRKTPVKQAEKIVSSS